MMKKVFLLGMVMLGTFALTGCEIIEGLLKGGEDLINEKKDYKYDDFVVEIADDDFSFTYTKCKAVIEENGEKSEVEYTYNKEDNIWCYEYEKESSSGETTHVTNYDRLDVVSFTKSCKLAAGLLDKDVDNVFKFSKSKTGYVITGNYKDNKQQVEAEYIFGTEGLMTSRNEKSTDLNSVKAETKKVAYTYSE